MLDEVILYVYFAVLFFDGVFTQFYQYISSRQAVSFFWAFAAHLEQCSPIFLPSCACPQV